MFHNTLIIFSAIGAVVMTAFFAFAKSLSKSLGTLTKKNILVLVSVSLLNVFLLFAIASLMDSFFGAFWVFCLVYLVFGVANFVLMHERFLPLPEEKRYPYVFAEIFFSMGVMLFVTIITMILIYFIEDRTFLFYPVMFSVLIFLLPQFFYYTFDAATNIPATDFLVWQYPSARIDPPDESLNENLLVIGFNISKKISEKKTVFRAKAPESIILGELFYHFINEYNEEKSETPIEYLDEQKEPIIWWFRLQRKWYQFNKVLDPNVRMKDNFIKENSVIICEQLNTAKGK